MPRHPRLHVSGGHYHVILRGNHRQALFGDASDRLVLGDIVADVIGRFGARIHAFCWMTNHLHVLVQIADRPLGTIMQRIAMRYSRHRHIVMNTTGHLFERRYKAKLVDVDAYFLILLRYIHLNPVRAHLVTDPADYPWSSHRAFLGTESIPWLTTDFGLALFSPDLARARVAYRRFILQSGHDGGQDLADTANSTDSRILGTDQFISRLPKTCFKPLSTLTLEQLAANICADYSVSIDVVRSRSSSRRLTPIRLTIVTTALDQRIASLTEVSRYLNRDPSTFCKLLVKHGRKVQ